jgi:hypothetical protein
MRIAGIIDAHANLSALDAALTAIRAGGADAVYHTGDAIGLGPFPAEVLDRLLHEPGMRSVMGNHDAWIAFGLSCPGRPGWVRGSSRTSVGSMPSSTRPSVLLWWPGLGRSKRTSAAFRSPSSTMRSMRRDAASQR